MSDPVTEFFAAWSMPDRATRHTTIKGAMDTAFSYADPRTQEPLTDLDALTGYVGMFIDAAPGAIAEVVSADVQQHHQTTRATISFRMADGMEQMGQYFVEHAPTGKITRMSGFVGTGARP